MTTYCLSGDVNVMIDYFHIRSELLRWPFDLHVALVAQASDISVSSVVDCEKGSVVHIFLVRRIDGCTICLSTVAGDGFLIFIAVFVTVTVNRATFSLFFRCVDAISGAMPGS